MDHNAAGPQNDVSVYEMGGKRFLFQSIDSGQTAEDCTSADSPIDCGGRAGLRGRSYVRRDRSREPQFVDMIQTACGSHTHTLVPAGSSASTSTSRPIRWAAASRRPAQGPALPPCRRRTRRSRSSRSAARQPSNISACARSRSARHDDRTAASRCATTSRSTCRRTSPWRHAPVTPRSGASPTRPTRPRATASRTRTSKPVRCRPVRVHAQRVHQLGRQEVRHDGRDRRRRDRRVRRRCHATTASTTSTRWSSQAPAPQLEARYTIPRPQTPEICVSHNGNVMPLPRPRRGGGLVLPGWQHGDRLHRPRQRPRDRMVRPGGRRPASPTRGLRTGTTAACT